MHDGSDGNGNSSPNAATLGGAEKSERDDSHDRGGHDDLRHARAFSRRRTAATSATSDSATSDNPT